MGLELCFGLLVGLVGQSGLRLQRLIDALSNRPARIAGIEPPALREGALAELVLVDPAARWRPKDVALRSKSRNTPFMDHELTGKVLMTVARGRVVFEAGAA
jgi:dihydroorotase